MTEYEAYQEHIRYTHDTYCRIVIRHASFDAARMLAARWKREISLEYLTEEKFVPLSTTDEYFQVPDYDKTDVLKNISLSLPAGSLTAFVGASGAGKTTAAQLIPKFWEVAEGSICIDGKNILELKNDNLMDLVSFVFQETFTLHDSIYENIAIGNKEATPQQVEDAARAAQIHDFIMSLPNGYKTKLGEDGVKLSGGEKQRICIARAILKDSPIIIFDEATSFADMENEHKIQLALSCLLKGKTTIMIAHRLHTIMGADQICVFHEGRLLEKGKHDELVSKGGRYADMWRSYTQEVTA